jgi:phosphoribosylaminoimidazole-succinocarboxamide synthase
LKKQKLLHEGKAKSVYYTDDAELFVMHYRNDATAFNGVKKESLINKGSVNNKFNAFIMDKLEQSGVQTHHVQLLNENESLVKSLDMIPVECVVRNYAAGSICKRLGLEKGIKFSKPVFEFFYKDDSLGDPMINESHITTFNWATEIEIERMRSLTFQVNNILSKLFLDAGITLVDYKLEFGRSKGKIVLGDEFTPDGCRLWDVNTNKVLDKDRFRQDMGGVIEAYVEVAERLGVSI